VIETHPLVDGAPFPTLFWLTCRRAIHAIGQLESTGVMEKLRERVRDDEAFADELRAAEADYKLRRDALHVLPGFVGGAPSGSVKCLHVHYAHHLVCGCNPVGAWTAERIGDVHTPPPCV
jgi:hypothetical protein